MSGRQVNIYLQEKTYNIIRELVGPRQISRYINQALEEKLSQQQKSKARELKQKLIAGYQANAHNTKLQEELSEWEKISSEDIVKKIKNSEIKQKNNKR